MSYNLSLGFKYIVTAIIKKTLNEPFFDAAQAKQVLPTTRTLNQAGRSTTSTSMTPMTPFPLTLPQSPHILITVWKNLKEKESHSSKIQTSHRNHIYKNKIKKETKKEVEVRALPAMCQQALARCSWTESTAE